MSAREAEIAHKLRDTFKSWRSHRPDASLLRGLVVVEQQIRGGLQPEKAVAVVIEQAIAILADYAPVQAQLLEKRWIGAAMGEVAEEETRSEADLYRKQGVAFTALARVILHLEAQLRQERHKQLLRHLPPQPYTHLVGAKPKIDYLLPFFRQPEAPWLVALIGMGGIGKTSLCRAIVEELIQEGTFEKVAWVSAQQVLLSLDGTMQLLSDKPALTQATLVSELGWQLLDKHPDQWRVPAFQKAAEVKEKLLTFPSVVVVDNLETVPDLHRLLPFLQSVRGSSKFILTSRESFTWAGDVFNYAVPPLDEAETWNLILQEANYRHILSLLDCDLATAKIIYEVTGGNPLAIRLVVGQIHLHGLNGVLADLREPRGIGTSLHRYLYDWVWHTLSANDRTVLNTLLTLTDENSTVSAIQRRSELDLSVVNSSLSQLITQNLVISEGNLAERRYTLHNITRAFLEEVNRNHGNHNTSSSS